MWGEGAVFVGSLLSGATRNGGGLFFEGELTPLGTMNCLSKFDLHRKKPQDSTRNNFTNVKRPEAFT